MTFWILIKAHIGCVRDCIDKPEVVWVSRDEMYLEDLAARRKDDDRLFGNRVRESCASYYILPVELTLAPADRMVEEVA